MSNFERIVQLLSRVILWVAAGVVVIMMLLQAVNVISRAVYQPILGTEEIIGYGLVVVVFFGLAYTAVKGAHIGVYVLINRLPPRVRAAVTSITTLLGVGVFSIIAWQSGVFAWEQWLIGERAPVLQYPLLPLRFVVVIGCTLLCLVLLIQLFKLLAKVFQK